MAVSKESSKLQSKSKAKQTGQNREREEMVIVEVNVGWTGGVTVNVNATS